MTPSLTPALIGQSIVWFFLLWAIFYALVQIAGRIALGVVRYFEHREIRRNFQRMLDNEDADAGFLIEYHALQRETRPGVHLDRGLLIDAVFADMRAYRKQVQSNHVWDDAGATEASAVERYVA